MNEVNYKLEDTRMRLGENLFNPLHIVSIIALEDDYSEVLVDASLVRNPNIMKKYKVKVSSDILRKDQLKAIGNCGAKASEECKKIFGLKDS